jgi:hypothetical protein
VASGRIDESAGIAYFSTYNTEEHADLCSQKAFSKNRPKPVLMIDMDICHYKELLKH